MQFRLPKSVCSLIGLGGPHKGIHSGAGDWSQEHAGILSYRKDNVSRKMVSFWRSDRGP